jgi:hypothetical protein
LLKFTTGDGSRLHRHPQKMSTSGLDGDHRAPSAPLRGRVLLFLRRQNIPAEVPSLTPMQGRSIESRGPPLLFVVTVAFFGLLIWPPLVSNYFFIFDDFALVGLTLKSETAELLRASLIGFYRPLAQISFRVQALLFGWSMPGGFALISVLLHATNALLVVSVLRRLGFGPGAWVAGSFFLISPWASEAQFWISAQFDLWACFWILASINCFLRAAGAPRRQALWIVAGGLLGGASLLSKEAALVLPLLFVSCALLQIHGRRMSMAYGAWVTSFLVLLSVTYLIQRSHVLTMFGGAYGEMWTLIEINRLPSNAISYSAAFWHLPWDAEAPTSLIFSWIYRTCALSIVAAGIVLRRSVIGPLALIAAFLGSIAPAIWMPPVTGTTAGGRLAYIPSLVVCAVLASSISAVFQGRPWLIRGFAAVLLLAWCTSLSSLYYQFGLWTRAWKIAQGAVNQIGANGNVDNLYVPNLPLGFREGPYILKDYTFDFYPGPRPRVLRFDQVMLEHSRGRVHVVPSDFPWEWRAGETVLVIQIPGSD